MEFNLDTTIKELYDLGQISVRTFNCLNHSRYETLGDIVKDNVTPMDLMNLRNFGRKSYSEMEPILNNMKRCHVGMTPHQKEDLFISLGETIVGIITSAYAEVIASDSNVNTYLQAKYPQPCDMHELVMGDLENMLTVVEEYTLNENLEIRHSYKKFIELVIKDMEYAQEAENVIYAEYKRKNENLAIQMENFSYEQMSKFFLSPLVCNYLEKTYQEQIASHLSRRSLNFARKFLPHYTDLIKYTEEPLSSYRDICPSRYMKKTLLEIFQFNQKFRREFERVSKLSDDEIDLEIRMKSDYPYLIRKQRLFVFDFRKKNGHAPLFYLLYHYLRLSQNRSNIIYCLYHGIFDGKKRTLKEIGQIMNLTGERVRQIIEKKKVRMLSGRIIASDAKSLPPVKYPGWEYYEKLFALPFAFEETEEYLSLKKAEHLSFDFDVFASLVKLKADFMMKNVEGHTILFNKKYMDLKLSDCLDRLYIIKNAKYPADTFVSVDSIQSTVPKSLRPQMAGLIKFFATEVYKIQITEEKLYLPQNYIDISEELYIILSKRGKPMHVEDLFIEFKKLYPDHKYTDAMQIKPFLYKHKNIKPVGKTSCYALDSWEGVYFGSIRDLLVDLLSASEVPLHIDNLYDGVSKYFPNTTKASVAATMEDENLQRFVEFEGGYFGLTTKNYSDEYVIAASVQRYRFEDRIQMFKDFIDNYHRFPSYNGSDQESSLMRWYYNMSNGFLSVTEEQDKLFKETIKYYDELGYPRTSTEYDFLMKCQDIKEHINKHHTLPTNRETPELYAWLRRACDNYDSFTDKRRQYMTDLLNYILSLGFSV